MNKKSPVNDWAKKHKGETSQIFEVNLLPRCRFVVISFCH